MTLPTTLKQALLLPDPAFWGADLTKKNVGIILIHSHWSAVVVLVIVLFLFENLREKRSVPLTNSQVLHVLKALVAQQVTTTVLYECGQNVNEIILSYRGTRARATVSARWLRMDMDVTQYF